MGIKEFDVFVIGTGKSGRDVAMACAKAGKKVAIADNREYGGVCANRGCDPKKVLVSFTEILKRSEQMMGKGLTKMPEFSWEDLHKFKAEFTDAVPFVNERKLKEEGVELYHQSPSFLDENTLSVEGKTVKASKIVLATGRIPAPLYFEGSQYFKVSDDFLELEKLPKHIAFVGGGYIGMEFAHIAARLGVKVSLIHSHKRPLNGFDPEMVDLLVEASEALGIEFHWEARAQKIEKTKSGYTVFANRKGKTIAVKADMVFNTTGRVPAIQELDLEKGKVSYSKKGIEVNESLQNPQNPSVYACGDVAASEGLPLTPLASFESQIVISQLLDSQPNKKASYPPIPSVVFTLPKLASIGFSEEEARKRYKEIKIFQKDATDWYNPKHLHDKYYAFKIIAHPRTKKILGVHLIGAGADELINIFTVAMANELTYEDLKKSIFAYPTWGNDIKSMF